MPAAIYKQGFLIVIIDDQIEQTIPWVGTDNTAGAYTTVRHLIKLGHRRIAHMQGPPEYLASHNRYNGYRQALLEEGIIPGPDLVLVGDFLPSTGRACASILFKSAPIKVTPTIYIPCFTRVKRQWEPLRGIVGTTFVVNTFQ